MGLHGNYHLEAGYHEDSFRIPFFMTWPAKLSPQKISKASSQMDIATDHFRFTIDFSK